ncbi:MAG: M3 family oligoendopeptidase [Rhizobiales bacterium]|nr:M3 family oligoendopeptidase [Hyphomicrobiales bacterium]
MKFEEQFVRSNNAGKGAADLGDLPEWNLDDLYRDPESEELKADLARVQAEGQAFEARYKGRLAGIAESSDETHGLTQAIRAYEDIEDLAGRIFSYASLLYAGDSSDPVRAKFFGDVRESITEASAHLLFFTLELNRIEDDVLDGAMANSDLAFYRPWLQDIRRERPHQLEDRIEQLFLEKSVTGAGAWNRLFDETISSLKFDFDGELLDIEPILNKLTDSDGAVREKGAGAVAKVFGNNLRLFTLITNTLAKDKAISDNWRGFDDVADGRHLANRVEAPVVDALEKAVVDAYPRISHRYYALKAKWLGKETLPHWDRNAPLPGEPDELVSWGAARETVLSAYQGFSPKLAEIAQQFFDKNWIDAPVRPGKTPGAFSHPTVPSAHPYVLLNYQGKTRDVMTLAHELGHGVHQCLAAPLGALMASTPLTLAETASVFGEMLTFKAMLAKAESPLNRKLLLASKVEDMINTVVRQIAFYRFERRIHLERRNGELTSDQICSIWMEIQRESLGPAIDLRDGYENFWCYIPHFVHSPFYVYAYAFGDCLVNSLYAVYENAEDGFAERYLELLAAGGSKPHKELLEPFGLDATQPDFWQLGLGVIERMIDEIESLE